MDREQRVVLHKKQERLQVKRGIPNIGELSEGVPVIRLTNKGLYQYVKYNNVLYKQKFTKV
jgi:hypothetical protein